MVIKKSLVKLFNLHKDTEKEPDQSAGAVEYTDCIAAEG